MQGAHILTLIITYFPILCKKSQRKIFLKGRCLSIVKVIWIDKSKFGCALHMIIFIEENVINILIHILAI